MSDDMMSPTPQRELLNDGQRKELVNLLRSFRRDGRNGPVWDVPGIWSAIYQAEAVADSGVQLAAAALAAAANPHVRTPGFIARPGRHWPDLGDGARVQPTRVTTDVRCPEHPDAVMPCAACRARSRPPTPDELAAMRAAVRRTT